jgi:hypothetical protein
MSDRLSELHRQRALLQQHLAWLDREIALASQQGATQRPQISDPAPLPPTSPSIAAAAKPDITVATEVDRNVATTINVVAPTPTVASGATPPASPGTTTALFTPTTATNPLPDEVLDQYRVAPEAVQEDVRKGCFLYFGLAFILLFAVVAILWFAFRRA